MSEFTVRLRTWLCPYWERVEHAQQFLCRPSFLVVASSNPEDPLLEKTFSPEEIFTSLFSGDWKSLTFSVRRENSSSLLVVSCRNIFHFDERLVSLVTIRLWPAPLVSLVDSFKRFSLYGIPNKQFSTSKIAWWVIKILGRSFFLYIFYFQSRNKARKASPDFQPRSHADVSKEKKLNHISRPPPPPSDCCFTCTPSKFFPCTQKNLPSKFASFFHFATISPKNSP